MIAASLSDAKNGTAAEISKTDSALPFRFDGAMSRFEPSFFSGNNNAGKQALSSDFASGNQNRETHFADDFAADVMAAQRLRSRKRLFFPLNFQSSYKYPLIVWLHSDGCNEDQINQVMPHISLRNFVGVGIRGTRAADANGLRFEWAENSAGIGAAHDNVISAIEEAQQRFSVHSDRIVLAGYGSGGTMALRIAMREPNRFGGVVSVGGSMPGNSIKQFDALRNRRLPMLWQWAKENDRYTQSQLHRDCQMAMSIGSQVEIRQYPGDDEMDTVVLSDLNDWVMRTVIPGASQVTNTADSPSSLYSVN
ncbi:alpha/beta hydrolase [Rubripirellula obstinata]|uniref:alpha/beta hydrolase n=1 Tax=Rubripirellula obstinata TaxID=406547 RepID=UPI001390173B|nr:prolyl oligopeptidase family serine peptidase [Rubripirellula obstinata]